MFSLNYNFTFPVIIKSNRLSNKIRVHSVISPFSIALSCIT